MNTNELQSLRQIFLRDSVDDATKYQVGPLAYIDVYPRDFIEMIDALLERRSDETAQKEAEERDYQRQNFN